MSVGICDGLTVVEIGAGSVAVSMAGMVLADAGARVIKVEPPEGDRLRSLNPNGFLVWNRGKESVVADLRTSVGQDEFRALVAGADVVLEGFSVGTTEQWGIGAEQLTKSFPALIHCSVSAFGRTGAYSAIKPRDALVGAKAGLWARGSFSHREGPSLFPMPIASYGAAMQVVAGVCGALIVRDATGVGQRLDVTLYGGLEPADYFVLVLAQLGAKRGAAPSSDARSTMGATRFGVLVMTRDGALVQTSTMLPHQARALVDVAEVGAQLEDPKFARLPMFETAEDAQEFEDLLVNAFREKDLDYWLPRLLASPDVAFEVGGTSEQGTRHPQIIANGDVVTIDDPTHGPVVEIGPIGRFSTAPMTPTRSAPKLGDHGTLPSSRAASDSGPDASIANFGDGPFSGVTIVEFGYFYAMPYGVTMAAALGARVIKLEDLSGDPYRTSFGPEVASAKATTGKESISVNLRTQEGREIAHRLLRSADVFVNGFRTGVAEKLGLGADDLQAINPRLAYYHAAGYGSTGPYAHRALYAQAAQAVGGSFGRQVGYWMDPARSEGMTAPEVQAVIFPRLNHVIDGDSNAALAVFASLSLALLHQKRTNSGQRVETSMIGASALAYSDDFCRFEGKQALPLCDEEYFGTSALQRVYACAETSWVVVDVVNDGEFGRLCAALSEPALATDDRFATGPARASHDAELIAALEKCFASRTASECEQAMLASDVGCVAASMGGLPVATSFDPVLRESGLTVTYVHPLYGEMVCAAPPVQLSMTPGKVTPPCRLGEQSRSILLELGYAADQADALITSGVVKALEAAAS